MWKSARKECHDVHCSCNNQQNTEYAAGKAREDYKCCVRDERVAAPLMPHIALGKSVRREVRGTRGQRLRCSTTAVEGDVLRRAVKSVAATCRTVTHPQIEDMQTRAIRRGGGARGISYRGGRSRGVSCDDTRGNECSIKEM